MVWLLTLCSRKGLLTLEGVDPEFEVFDVALGGTSLGWPLGVLTLGTATYAVGAGLHNDHVVFVWVCGSSGVASFPGESSDGITPRLATLTLGAGATVAETLSVHVLVTEVRRRGRRRLMAR